MRKDTKHLLIFLAATFAWTWAFYARMAVGHLNQLQMPWMILLILGGMGPSLMGIAMVLLTAAPEQRRDYWRRCFSFRRIGPLPWGVILLLFPLTYGLAIAADRLLGGAGPGMQQFLDLMANPVMWPLAAFISLMSGPWAEEFGWRGYALDRFLRPFGILGGSVALGIVWAVWHLPLFFMGAGWHAGIGFGLTGFWTFLLLNTGLSLVMTWVYLSTNRSILSGILLHFTSNFTGQLLAPVSSQAEVIRVLLLLAIGLAACLDLARRTRTRPHPETAPAPL